MALNDLTIGIDMGGTRVRVALIDAQGKVASIRAWDHRYRSVDEFVAEVVPALREMAEPTARSAPAARSDSRDPAMTPIGLAVAGVIDPSRRFVVRSVNLPFLENVPLVECLEEATGRAARLFTDADAVTWGEFTSGIGDQENPPEFGNAKGQNFAHLRLGTGVALGIVADGALLPLNPHRTTHLEALVVDHSTTALPCRCGLGGCLETVVAGPVLIERARGAGINGGLKELNVRAAAGDAESLAMVREAADAVARAIENIVHRWNVAVVCLGGGVIEHLPVLLDLVAERFHSFDPGSRVHITRARLDDQAGCIGAARLSAPEVSRGK